MRSAASVSVRPCGRAGRTTQHPNVSSVVRARPMKLGSASSQPAWMRRAEDFDLTKGDRVPRADNHEMRLI